MVKVEDTERGRQVTLKPDDDSVKPIVYPVTRRAPMLVKDGDHVESRHPAHRRLRRPERRSLRILGPRAAQVNIVEEVHTVYRSQGVDIHDKHIEVIVHQMLRRITVIDSGDTDLLPGELVDKARFKAANMEAVKNGGKAGRRPSGADGHHQGFAGHRFLAVRGLLPGDHPRAHRSRPEPEGR